MPKGLFGRLLIILVLGLAVRAVNLDVPPINFHPTRQYRSALIARAQSTAALREFSPGQQEAATQMGRLQVAIEPQVMESAAATAYAILGREDLRAPRLLSILAWLLLAGLSVTWILHLAKMPAPWIMAGLLFTLFAPFGVDASRAFMPDPLMTGLTMMTLALSLRHHVQPGAAGLVLRVLAAGAAIYVKPMAALFLVPAVLALDVARLGPWRGLVLAGLTTAVAMLPSVAHYVALVAAGNPVAEGRFFVQLWIQPMFWVRWLARIHDVIGLPALGLSALGVWLSRGPLRLLLAGAWTGYGVMGLLFAHHISTHDYYSLPLVPLAGVAIVAGLVEVTRRLPSRAGWIATTAVVAIGVAFVPALRSHGYCGDIAQARQAAADYEHIGALVQHSTRVVSLDTSYGFALAYHARIVTLQLPLSGDRALSDLAGEAATTATSDLAERGGEYFVGTSQRELNAQPALRNLLEQRYALLETGGDPARWRYVVYDLARPVR
jgi:hypothetical protein